MSMILKIKKEAPTTIAANASLNYFLLTKEISLRTFITSLPPQSIFQSQTIKKFLLYLLPAEYCITVFCNSPLLFQIMKQSPFHVFPLQLYLALLARLLFYFSILRTLFPICSVIVRLINSFQSPLTIL